MNIKERVSLLDHGYMEYVEHWGSDERIIEAARMSTDKGFLGWDPGPCDACNGAGRVIGEINKWHEYPTYSDGVFDIGDRAKQMQEVQCLVCNGKGQLAGDAKLLKYLWTHKHGTPFEMAGFTLNTQAPIMVFREWHRHRTQSYNEMSARYVPLPDLNYIPTPERCLMVAGKSRQTTGITTADTLTHERVLEWLDLLAGAYEVAETAYQYGLQIGIPKELARLPVPVGRYSRMMASTDLRNWLAFLTLRMDVNAQWEIRQYANQVGRYVREVFPKTWDLFVEGKIYEL